MKRMFKSYIYKAYSLRSLFVDIKFNDMITVKGGLHLLHWFKKIGELGGFRLTKGVCRSYYIFSKHCHYIYKCQGLKGLTILLKSYYIGFLHCMGGYKVDRKSVRFASTSRGLPRIIPIPHRKRIRAGEVKYIRLWISLFSLYRVIEYTGSLKLNTITDPGYTGSPLLEKWELEFIPHFYKVFGIIPRYAVGGRVGFPVPFLGDWKPSFIFKASPSSYMGSASTSVHNLISSAKALKSSNIWEDFVKACQRFTPSPLSLSQFVSYLSQLPGWDDNYSPILGKLGLKPEAAGKVRVFAMVDCFTQWLLKPIHNEIFQLLKKVPMDGTFDQLRPLKEALKFGYKTKFYSFDLSAATDRLPVTLQMELLAPLYGRTFANSWKNLLVERTYILPEDKRFGVSQTSLKYAVGQPMGALSSWAMLALTHHAIVQYCWWSLGYHSLFRDYLLLGDDIVIINDKVAKRYLQVMRHLKVDINLSKSLISNHSLEFAKRFYYKGWDCSPIPLKEIKALISNLHSFTTTRLNYNLKPVQLLRLYGAGYKITGSFNVKNLRDLSPRYRVLCLKWLRDTDETFLSYYTRRSMSTWYSLTEAQVFKLAELIFIQYQRLIDLRIKSLRSDLDLAIKGMIQEVSRVNTGKSRLDVNQEKLFRFYFNALIEPLEKVTKSVNDAYLLLGTGFHQKAWVNLSTFNGMCHILHNLYEELCAVPSWKSILYSRGEDNTIEIKRFYRESAVWSSVNLFLKDLPASYEFSNPDVILRGENLLKKAFLELLYRICFTICWLGLTVWSVFLREPIPLPENEILFDKASLQDFQLYHILNDVQVFPSEFLYYILGCILLSLLFIVWPRKVFVDAATQTMSDVAVEMTPNQSALREMSQLLSRIETHIDSVQDLISPYTPMDGINLGP